MGEVVKRVVKTKSLDTALTPNLAIVVGYVLENHYKDGTKDETPGEKRLRIKGLDQGTNVPALAAQIVEKCKYIQNNKVSAVENLLYNVQYRVVSQEASGECKSWRGSGNDLRLVFHARVRQWADGPGRRHGRCLYV